jgi:aryl-alcohol dehydrogenase-like predicted oxidoreductase
MLTGKMNNDSKFPENDHRNYNIKGAAFDVGETFSGVNFEKGLEAVERLKDILPTGFSLTDLALKWILMHKEVTVVIPGAKNKEQVEKNFMASDKDDISEIISKINLVYDELIKSDVHGRW